MLEEMEAYAQKCLKIDTLERRVKELENELNDVLQNETSLNIIEKWFEIGETYLFVRDDYKDTIREKFKKEN